MCARRSRPFPSYGEWLRQGSGGLPGYRCVVNWSLLACVTVGVFLALVVDHGIEEAASVVLFPLAGVFIGVAFGWGSHALALLQTEELSALAQKNKGGFPDYVYTQQTAMLAVFLALVGWGLGGLGLADSYLVGLLGGWVYAGVEALLYALACVAVHECWHVVLGVQVMMLLRERIAHANRQERQLTGASGERKRP